MKGDHFWYPSNSMTFVFESFKSSDQWSLIKAEYYYSTKTWVSSNYWLKSNPAWHSIRIYIDFFRILMMLRYVLSGI